MIRLANQADGAGIAVIRQANQAGGAGSSKTPGDTKQERQAGLSGNRENMTHRAVRSANIEIINLHLHKYG